MKIRVPELVAQRNWTISEFQRRAGISYPTAHRLCQGEADAISLRLIDKLCKTFDVGVQDLFEAPVEV